MRYLVSVALSLVALALSFGSASAQVPTPTETWVPLYVDPTPAPTDYYDCPPGLPSNWGTVTPDVGWQMNCSHCLLTLTPAPTSMFPTFTPSVTSTLTGTLTATLSATVTPSPTPTLTPTPSGVANAWACYETSHGSCGSYAYTDPLRYLEGGSGPNMSVKVNECMLGSCPSPATDGQVRDAWVHVQCDRIWSSTVNYAGGRNQRIRIHNDATARYYLDETISCGSGYGGSCDIDRTIFVPGSTLPGGINNQIQVRWTGDGIINGDDAIACGIEYTYSSVSLTPTPTLTPTPAVSPTPDLTATPSAPSYCSALPVSVTRPPSLPVPVLGPIDGCAEIPPFAFDVSGLAAVFSWLPELISFPGFEVCVRPLSFGSVRILDISINLDFFFQIAVLAMLLRWFFRS